MRAIDRFAKRTGEHRRDTASSLEVDRIVRLPIVELPTSEEIEAFCEEEVEARHFEDGFRLFPTQVGAVLAYDLYGGLFAPIGVGWGKTLITLMVANRAFNRKEADRILLLVPSQVYHQLTHTDIPWARKRVDLRVPFLLMGGKSKQERMAMASSGKRGCYVMPYSLLSAKDAHDVLQGIEPELVILDEAHWVKNADAARTKRVMGYISQRQPKLVALSGTITSKSIRDYHHLISNALREYSPLPMDPALATNWSFVLDADAEPSEAQVGHIVPLINWARKHYPSERLPIGIPGFRQAYKMRLRSSPGVVSTGDLEIGVSLIIENIPVPNHTTNPGWKTLSELIKQVEELWITPSGDEIDYGFHKWRYLFELSSGFYYKQRWPTPAELVSKGKLSAREAEAYLVAAQEHHEALQTYHRELRRWLQYQSKPKLDTPFLVGADMHTNGAKNVGNSLYEVWHEAKELEFDDMPQRISEPVRICDYKIEHALQWAREHPKGGLIWFHHDDLGRWVADRLKEEGINAIWCPADSVRKGSNAVVENPANADKILIASIGGHCTGKNLQHFQDQLFLQFPRESARAEQAIGRTHRNGQRADEIVVHTMNTILFDHLNLSACLVDALYIQQTTGTRQKLCYAGYNPLPKMYPEDFLRERGFMDVKHLDASTRALLVEKFGPLEEHRRKRA